MQFEWLIPIGYAVGGQLARITLGLIKAWRAGEDIHLKRTVTTLVEAVVVGFLASLFTKDSNLLFVTGFAGTDALESLVKIAHRD